MFISMYMYHLWFIYRSSYTSWQIIKISDYYKNYYQIKLYWQCKMGNSFWISNEKIKYNWVIISSHQVYSHLMFRNDSTKYNGIAKKTIVIHILTDTNSKALRHITQSSHTHIYTKLFLYSWYYWLTT